jgi:metal-responsive CopG/Arc/MetJ family transcriptional regulator
VIRFVAQRQEYNGGMKQKTSVTLSGDILAGIDRLAGSSHSRSAFIERVLRGYLRHRQRAEVQKQDLRRLNRAAKQLNAEVADVIEYQAPEE